MKHFKVKFAGDFYAADFYGHSKAEVRQDVLKYLRKTRLPRGTEIYETSPQSVRIVSDSMRSMANDYHKAGQICDF